MADLKDLGLSDYEASVYRTLIDKGSATAKELSEDSGVPMGRVYDVLGSLEKHSLIRSQTASRPKKYVAVEPETALERLLEDKRRELQEEIDRYETIAEELMENLEASEPVEERFWTATVGPEESMDLLFERLESADDSVVIIVEDISPQFDIDEVGDLFLDQLNQLTESGVEVSILMTPALLDSFGRRIGKRADNLSDSSRFEVRTAENLRGTFNIIDSKEVCIEVTNPLSPDRFLAMIDLKDPDFASRMTDEFMKRWQNAEPLSP